MMYTKKNSLKLLIKTLLRQIKIHKEKGRKRISLLQVQQDGMQDQYIGKQDAQQICRPPQQIRTSFMYDVHI